MEYMRISLGIDGTFDINENSFKTDPNHDLCEYLNEYSDGHTESLNMESTSTDSIDVNIYNTFEEKVYAINNYNEPYDLVNIDFDDNILEKSIINNPFHVPHSKTTNTSINGECEDGISNITTLTLPGENQCTMKSSLDVEYIFSEGYYNNLNYYEQRNIDNTVPYNYPYLSVNTIENNYDDNIFSKQEINNSDDVEEKFRNYEYKNTNGDGTQTLTQNKNELFDDIIVLSSDEDDEILEESVIYISDTDSYCSGYHSSDFEFITEEEAYNGGIKSSDYESKDISLMHSNSDVSTNHTIPQDGDLEGLFRMQFVDTIRYLENKSLYTRPIHTMSVDNADFGFDIKTFQAKNDLFNDEELRKEAEKTKTLLLEMYPEENRRHPSRRV